MLAKLTHFKAALIITILGIVVFASGLRGPFMGDDLPQIVDNVPVHSIGNLMLFFEGGTFYNAQGLEPLSGAYYRPLMVTAYSAIYSLFGASCTAFHAVQLALYILAAFAIPALQEPLYFVFGMSALLLLLRFSSIKSLGLVALFLLLSVLAKETGILFMAAAVGYVALFDRRRLLPLAGILVLPVVAYLGLRANAVGLLAETAIAPIDHTNVWSRLLTAPSLLAFYITCFIWPVSLASSYYWVHEGWSWSGVALPLALDAAAIAGAAYLTHTARRRLTSPQFLTWLYFLGWAGAGLLLHLHIIPLDMTACDLWFYFPMVGVLGLIGLTWVMYRPRVDRCWLIAGVVVLISLLGLRTALRGLDWRGQYALAQRDIAVNATNFNAENIIAYQLFHQGELPKAKRHAERSVSLHPAPTNYNTLGQILAVQGDYAAAARAFEAGIRIQKFYPLYENRAALTAGSGDEAANRAWLQAATRQFPQNAKIWFYLAILEYRAGRVPEAQGAISQAYHHDPVGNTAIIYERIMAGQPLNVEFSPLSPT